MRLIEFLTETYTYDTIAAAMFKSAKAIKDQNEFLSKMNVALKGMGKDKNQLGKMMNDNDLISDTMAAYKSLGGKYGKKMNEELDISADASPQAMQKLMKDLQKELADHKKVKNAELVDQIEQDIHELAALMKRKK